MQNKNKNPNSKQIRKEEFMNQAGTWVPLNGVKVSPCFLEQLSEVLSFSVECERGVDFLCSDCIQSFQNDTVYLPVETPNGRKGQESMTKALV